LPGLAADLTKRSKRGGKTASFPILQTNSYGRTMIKKQMHTHDHLIGKAGTRTDAWIGKVVAQQMQYNRKLEKWRPSHNYLQEKALTDEILAQLISTAAPRCETKLGDHILRFKEERARYPVYKLGWLEAYTEGKNMAVHEELLRKAGSQIDNKPPKMAMQFRDFLRGCKFTRGGFLRKDLIKGQRRGDSDCGSSSASGCSLPSIKRTQSLPPAHLYVKKKTYDACGREKKINPVLVNKYSELLFRSHVCAASNENVRSLYTETNEQEDKLPSMADFMRKQGLDLSKMETQMSQTATPFGLMSVQEEDDEQIQEVWDQHLGTRQLSKSAPPNRTFTDELADAVEYADTSAEQEAAAAAIIREARIAVAAEQTEAVAEPAAAEKPTEAATEPAAAIEKPAAAAIEKSTETSAEPAAEPAAAIEKPAAAEPAPIEKPAAAEPAPIEEPAEPAAAAEKPTEEAAAAETDDNHENIVEISAQSTVHQEVFNEL